MLRCWCCGKGYDTSGGCLDCTVITIHCMCGAKFCAKHRGQDYEKHQEVCPNIIRINTTVHPQPLNQQSGISW